MKFNSVTNSFEEIQHFNTFERCATTTVFTPSNAKDGDIYVVLGNLYMDGTKTYKADSFIYKFNKNTLQLELYQTLTGIYGITSAAFLNVPDFKYNNGFLLLSSYHDSTDPFVVATIYDWIEMLRIFFFTLTIIFCHV